MHATRGGARGACGCIICLLVGEICLQEGRGSLVVRGSMRVTPAHRLTRCVHYSRHNTPFCELAFLSLLLPCLYPGHMTSQLRASTDILAASLRFPIRLCNDIEHISKDGNSLSVHLNRHRLRRALPRLAKAQFHKQLQVFALPLHPVAN